MATPKKKVVTSSKKQIIWGLLSTDDSRETLEDVIDREIDYFYLTKQEALSNFDEDYKYNYIFELEVKNVFSNRPAVAKEEELIKVTLK